MKVGRDSINTPLLTLAQASSKKGRRPISLMRTHPVIIRAIGVSQNSLQRWSFDGIFDIIAEVFFVVVVVVVVAISPKDKCTVDLRS